MNEFSTVSYINKKWMKAIMFIVWYANILKTIEDKAKGIMPRSFFVCFHASTGIGKTAIMTQFLKYHSEIFGKQFFSNVNKINLSIMDGADFEVPVANHQEGTVKKVSLLNFDSLPQVIEVDEVNRYLSSETINGMTRIVLDRDGTTKPSEGSLVVCCANSLSDQGTKPFPKHLVSRGMHIYLTENDEEGIDGNVKFMIDGSYPDWMIDTFKAEPTKSRDDFQEIATYEPRTLEFCKYIDMAISKAKTNYKVEIPDSIVRSMFAGLVGSHHANRLMKHRDMAKLPTLGAILNDPTNAIIPDTNLDPALRKKFILNLIKEVKNDVLKADKLMEYLLRFSAEFQRYSVESLVDSCPELTKRPKYIQWKRDQDNN